MVWLGLVLVIATFAGIIMHYDTRLCLMLGGFVMCVVAGQASAAVPAYCNALINGTVIYYTVISMGYATVMAFTGYTDHLVYALLKPLSKVKAALVPGSVIVSWFIMQGLSSAATVGTVAGGLLIPIMVGLGINPATAAAAILAATGAYGPMLNPAGSFTLLAIEACPPGECSGVEMVKISQLPGWISLVAGALTVMVAGKIFDKMDAGKGHVDSAAAQEALMKAESFVVNPVFAVMPLVPLVIVLVANFTPLLDAKIFTVATAMFIGLVITVFMNLKNYKTIITQFFKGQGNSFDNVITLMGAAAVFTAGMSACGITNALVEIMKANPSVAAFGASYGPLLIAAVSGSGNSACIAFINSVLPFAKEFGYDFNRLGLVCQFSASWGRSCSPVAAVTIIVAKIAGVDPFDVIKRTIPASLVVSVIYMVMVL